jgi:hypothetical protein
VAALVGKDPETGACQIRQSEQRVLGLLCSSSEN